MAYKEVEEFIKNLTFEKKRTGGVDENDAIAKIRDLIGIYGGILREKDASIRALTEENAALKEQAEASSGILGEAEAGVAALEALRAEKEELDAALEAERRRAEELSAEKERTEERLGQLEQEAEALRAELEAAKRASEALRAEAERLKLEYKAGSVAVQHNKEEIAMNYRNDVAGTATEDLVRETERMRGLFLAMEEARIEKEHLRELTRSIEASKEEILNRTKLEAQKEADVLLEENASLKRRNSMLKEELRARTTELSRTMSELILQAEQLQKNIMTLRDSELTEGADEDVAAEQETASAEE